MLAMAERNKLKEILESRGISLYQAAKDTGVSYPTIFNLANSDHIPPKTWYGTLKTIADYLGVSIDDLEGNGE